MGQWDDLPADDQEWALAAAERDSRRCPVCGGDDPERLCQNPKTQHAWTVTTTRCYKQLAVLRTMEKWKNDPYASTVVPHVTLDPARMKP